MTPNEINAMRNFLFLNKAALFDNFLPAISPESLQMVHNCNFDEFVEMNPGVNHKRILSKVIAEEIKKPEYLGRLLISARFTQHFVDDSCAKSRSLFQYELIDIESRFNKASFKTQSTAVDIFNTYCNRHRNDYS